MGIGLGVSSFPSSLSFVHAEYAVHSNGDWEKNPRACVVRLLRVALEHPFASPAGRYMPNLLVFIELSEEHRYASLIRFLVRK